VYQRNRITIGLLDLAQKWDELAGVFRGDFEIVQHDPGRVQPAFRAANVLI
jgi:hypothetical protein